MFAELKKKLNVRKRPKGDRSNRDLEEETGGSRKVQKHGRATMAQGGGGRRAPDSANGQSKLFAHKFTKATLEKGVQGLRAEFASMKRANDFTQMQAFMDNLPKNRNRYKDVGCLDASRVALKDTRNGWTDYIHANYVSTPQNDKRFICCQAPLEGTCHDFWRMMIQDQCGIIIMLCNFMEKGVNKCWEYFPANKGDAKTFLNITIKNVASSMMTFTCETNAKVKQSTFLVEQDGKLALRCDHYHWIDWPDRGVPPTDVSVTQLLDRIRGCTTPIVVHCSAGIGRTGSVVLIEYVLEACGEGLACETVDSLLIKLRKQRNASVQTDQQYLYIHAVLLEYFSVKGFLDKSLCPLLATFSEQYNKAVIV